MGFFGLGKKQRTITFNGDNLTIHNVQAKEWAIDVVANFIARTFSQSEFRISDKLWSYRLNVKPNKNQSSTEFWREVIYRLYKEGEALVILTRDNDLILADSFNRVENAPYSDKFNQVQVNNYRFSQTFDSSEVFYFTLNNEKLSLFTNSIYNDYEKLLGSIYSATIYSNQLRYKLKMDTANLDSETEEMIEILSSDATNKLENSSVVSLPANEVMEYEEIHSPESNTNFIGDFDRATYSFLNKVALICGVPPVLLGGEVAGVKDAMEEFYINCLEPLNRLIEAEINSTIFDEYEWDKDEALNIVGVNKPSVLDMAQSVDKLVSSGTFNRNEIRMLLGYEPVEGLSEFVITKNYTEDTNLKGGEEDNGEQVL